MKSKELEDLTAQCIRCGFCLESCPTFKLTGSESDSPRGRIYLLRSAQAGTIPLETARSPIDRCLGCQACETACPSGVQYGKILSQGRTLLEKQKPSLKNRFLLNLLTNPSTSGIAVKGGILTRKLPKPTPLPPRPPILLENPKGEVLLLEGCVMKHLYPEVHIATKRLVNAVGYRIRSLDAGCCGALHAHNGYLEIAKSMSDRGSGRERRWFRKFSGENSAFYGDAAGAWVGEKVQKKAIFERGFLFFEEGSPLAKDFSVLHAAGAGGFARLAAEAAVYWAASGFKGDGSGLGGAEKINSAARGI